MEGASTYDLVVSEKSISGWSTTVKLWEAVFCAFGDNSTKVSQDSKDSLTLLVLLPDFSVSSSPSIGGC